MSLTSIIRPIFYGRMRAIENYADKAEALQRGVLKNLLSKATDTEWGHKFNFESLKTYEAFASNVPFSTYEDLKSYIDRMRRGEKHLLWPGRVRWYAKSSGTTNDKSKFIPVSKDGLKHVHYAGGVDTVVIYLRNNPKSRLFDGKALILGGSHASNYNLRHSFVGDLSAILIENINPLINLVRIPSKRVALLEDFEKKRDCIAALAMKKDVTNLSGVPSWMMAVLHRVLELSGKQYIDELWPNLEIFFHGGVAFSPYREQYLSLIRSPKMQYEETYNASEGFFGIQDDPLDPALLLMVDYEIFYEFMPLEDVGKAQPRIFPLWEVEVGKNYAILISTSCGLWRYEIGDTIRFTQKNPYKFVISGRTKCFINAFGEELIVDNAEKGLAEACRRTGAVVNEYTAAPVFMNAEGQCRHQWVVEFKRMPASIEEFAEILDSTLQKLNSDYEAKRFKNITLQRLELIPARKDLFNDWLKSKGKLGGQHKVPRLSNNRSLIEQVLKLNS